MGNKYHVWTRRELVCFYRYFILVIVYTVVLCCKLCFILFFNLHLPTLSSGCPFSCSFSKASFLEDVLGVGLVVERHSSGNLKTLSSPMDLISRNAFFHQSIRSMLPTLSFSLSLSFHFFPSSALILSIFIHL